MFIFTLFPLTLQDVEVHMWMFTEISTTEMANKYDNEDKSCKVNHHDSMPCVGRSESLTL